MIWKSDVQKNLKNHFFPHRIHDVVCLTKYAYHKDQPNVGKYAIHAYYGFSFFFYCMSTTFNCIDEGFPDRKSVGFIELLHQLIWVDMEHFDTSIVESNWFYMFYNCAFESCFITSFIYLKWFHCCFTMPFFPPELLNKTMMLPYCQHDPNDPFPDSMDASSENVMPIDPNPRLINHGNLRYPPQGHPPQEIRP